MLTPIPQVTLYTNPSCGPCKAAARWLTARGVPFTAVNLAGNPAVADQLREAGITATPVIAVGEQLVAGFRPDRLGELLGLAPVRGAA